MSQLGCDEDHLHGKASAGESPALAHTCDSCGQQIFLLKAKLVRIGQKECVNEPNLVFQKELGPKGPKNWSILRVFVCPICVPLWKPTTTRVNFFQTVPFFYVFPPAAFGADVQKISTQSDYVYYGKITIIPKLTGAHILS